MNKELDELNASGAPVQKTQVSLEGLSSPEVRNLNNEAQETAPNGGEEINGLVSPNLSQGVLETAPEASHHHTTGDVRKVDGEVQVAGSSQLGERDFIGRDEGVDPVALARAISLAITEPIAKAFEMSEPDGFCWIGLPKELLRATMTSLADVPARLKVPALLVLFDGRRIELNEELPIQIQVSGQEIKVTLSNSNVMAVKISRAKVLLEDTLETLGNAVRSAGHADSEIFVHVTVDRGRFEVPGWVTGSGAKAYRRSHVIDKPAAA
jgi:hypothetical protein